MIKTVQTVNIYRNQFVFKCQHDEKETSSRVAVIAERDDGKLEILH